MPSTRTPIHSRDFLRTRRLLQVLSVCVVGFLILLGGLMLGAASWAISPWVSGQFEPFDSGLALTLGQMLMSLYSGTIGYRFGLWKLVLAVFGLYAGQVGYWYVFGSSEARAWIVLGAFSTLLLCVLPVLSGFLGIAIRRFWRAKRPNS